MEDIQEILNAYHKTLLGGHAGISRMKNNIKKFYSWPSMTKDVREFIKNCPVCEKSKIQKHTRMPMQITSTASEPFQKVYIDFVGEINPPSAKGHKHIFTAICDLTKYVIAVPTYDCTAESAARAFVKHLLLKHNIPSEVISDNGPAFFSDLFKEINRLFKIKKVFTTPYRPQANTVERFHRTLAQYLRAFTVEEPNAWHKMLHYATFSYNNSVNSTTGHSPHALIFGYDIKIPVNITNGVPSYNYDTYKRELQTQLRATRDLAKDAIQNQKETNKRYYDKRTKPLELKVNDLVLRRNDTKKLKFENPYSGPYRVTKIISPSVVKIKIGKKVVKTHVDKLIRSNADYGTETPAICDGLGPDHEIFLL